MAKAELGVLLQDLRGKAGNVVFQKSRDGLIVKPRVKETNPQTPAQMAVRANLTRASQAYEALTSIQVEAWRNYARTLVRHNPVSGKAYVPTAINSFTELASKFLQVNPLGVIPLAPPSSSFEGDTITLTATPGVGEITFTASAANSINVKTEFLVQPLKGPNRRAYPKAYRSKGFFAFAAGTLTYDITVPAGYYAVGYRFVNVNTGQATDPTYLTLQQVTLSLSEGGTSTAKTPSKKAA